MLSAKTTVPVVLLVLTARQSAAIDPATGDVGVASAFCVPSFADALAALVPGKRLRYDQWRRGAGAEDGRQGHPCTSAARDRPACSRGPQGITESVWVSPIDDAQPTPRRTPPGYGAA